MDKIQAGVGGGVCFRYSGKCFVAMTSEQKLEWDGGQAKCHLEIEHESKTICVKRQIKREHT